MTDTERQRLAAIQGMLGKRRSAAFHAKHPSPLKAGGAGK